MVTELRWICGWEANRLDEAADSNDHASLTGSEIATSPTPEYGTYCFTPATGDIWRSNISTIMSVAIGVSFAIGFRFRYSSHSTSVGASYIIARTVDTTPVTAGEVCIYNNSGNLKLQLRDNGTSLGIGSTTISANTWYYVEVFWRQQTGAWELRINGSTEISGTSSFSNGTIGAINFLGQAALTGLAFDDAYLVGDPATTSDLLGPIGVVLHPDDSGTAPLYANWDTGASTDIDDLPGHDSGTTVITDSTGAGGHIESLAMGTFTESYDAIVGLQSNAWGIRTTNPDALVRVGIARSGPNNWVSADINFNKDTWDRCLWIASLNSTVLDNFSTSEPSIQYQQAQSRQVNVTALGLMVAFTPAAAAVSSYIPENRIRRNTLLRM